jgi:hypothetical protein
MMIFMMHLIRDRFGQPASAHPRALISHRIPRDVVP